MRDFLTIIIPVYKIRETYLRECIDSIIMQNHQGCKVLLIDDGSPDNCGKICDEYAQNNSFIEAIHQENKGVSVARNLGLDNTSTKWVAFVDADDWLSSDYINGLKNLLNKKELDYADIVMFDYVREFKNHRNNESLAITNGFLNEDHLKECRKALFYKLMQNGTYNPYTVIGLWNKVYSTDFINKNELRFNPAAKKGQDRLFNAEAINATSSIYYVNKEYYHYRCWEDSRTNRFDPNIINLTKIEINSLQATLRKYALENMYQDDLNSRICTRLYACMRLYYFNPLNEMKYGEVKKEILALVDSEPFFSAFKSVRLRHLTFPEIIFVECVRFHWIALLSVMVKIKSGLTKRKLA